MATPTRYDRPSPLYDTLTDSFGKRIGLSVLAAALLSAGWYKWTALLVFFGPVPLLLLEDYFYRNGGKIKRAGWRFFLHAYLAVVLWNFGVYWWLWNATPGGALGAWFANAALQCLPLALYHSVRRNSEDKFGYLAFICIWMAFEYVHLWWDFSWIWLNLGNAFGAWPSWVQWYEYTGAFGGTLWVLLGAGAAYEALFRKGGWGAFAASLILPMAVSLVVYFTYQEQGQTVEVVLTQPGVDCYTEKFPINVKTGQTNERTHVPYREQRQRLFRLADSLATDSTKFVICPEASFLRDRRNGIWERQIDSFAETQEARGLLSKYPGLAFVTGLTTYRLIEEGEPSTNATRFLRDGSARRYERYNAAMLLPDDRLPAAFYRKSQLVIGVETMPPFLQALILDFGGDAGSMGRQKERTVFKHPEGVALAPVICYESCYGEFLTEYVRNGADFFAVMTNDGWWGDTPGHVQHMRFSCLRAIETRRDVVRSANTGITCFIDQKGVVRARTDYGPMDALRGTVRLNDEETLYVRMGDYLGKLAAFLAAFMALSAFVNGRVNLRKRRK